jgi:glycosyltransferase involved in cell wall biosynthesis
LKILYFADIRFPLERANGIQTMQTCYALAEMGHEVRLVVRQDTARPARDPYTFYQVPARPGLDIARVRVAGSPAMRRLFYLARAVLRSWGAAADAVITRDLGTASLLLRLPGRRRPPIVYESHGYAPVVAGGLPALLSDGREATSRKQHRLNRRERRVWCRADGYVAITKVLADELAERFGPRDRVAVIPDGVRLEPGRRFEPPVPAAAPVVAYAGHLYPWKGVNVLLHALTLLPGVRGVIVGGHPGERDLEATERTAEDLGLGARVRFTGAVPPAEVARLLGETDILVLPNTATHLSARYTSPLKLFEYLAAGKPIVASDLPALREVLTDGRNAVLTIPGSAESLAAAIGRVVEDPALAARIARTAFDDASEYSWARRAERYEALLGTIVSTQESGIGNQDSGIGSSRGHA